MTQSTIQRTVPPPPRWDPALAGTLFNALSALAYTAANICLRDASRSCDPVWISCIKAVPTALVAWLIIARRASRGMPALPSGRLLPALIGTALVMQVGGNVSFQWALPVLGLALSVPLVFGTLILAGAAASRAILGEPIGLRTLLAMALLIAAIAVLSWGAEARQEVASAPEAEPVAATTADAASWLAAVAVAVACFSGLCYASCNVLIRRVAGPETPLSAILMVMAMTGVISLGAISLWRIGWAGMAATTAREWMVMILAGAFNAAAFFSLGLALERTPVTRTNLINASQVALSAAAGVVLFGEEITATIVAGIALTVIGLTILRRA